MFEDRHQAGKLLALKLQKYQSKPGVLVLAIPRGGVVVGRVVADALQIPLGVVYAKKTPTPDQPELAAGARITKSQKFGKTPVVGGKTVTFTAPFPKSPMKK